MSEVDDMEETDETGLIWDCRVSIVEFYLGDLICGWIVILVVKFSSLLDPYLRRKWALMEMKLESMGIPVIFKCNVQTERQVLISRLQVRFRLDSHTAKTVGVRTLK